MPQVGPGNRYRGGQGLVVQWVTQAGTVVTTYTIHQDYTTFDVDRQIDLVDVSAGNDTDKSYVQGLKSGNAKLKFFDTGNAGSAMLATMVEGSSGTLIYAPKGTAVGSPKRGFVAIVKELKEGYPIDKGVEYETTFEKNGPMVYDVGTTY